MHILSMKKKKREGELEKRKSCSPKDGDCAKDMGFTVNVQLNTHS